MNEAKQGCYLYHEQDCLNCDDFACGDNINPKADKKILYVRVTRDCDNGKGGFTDLPEDVDVSALFDGADDDEGYLLRGVFMTRREYSKLPEFTGF